MVKARKKRKAPPEHGAFDLLEEAFHALRVAPLSVLALYYVGSVPFVLALFYFWADMSRSSYASQDAALASLLVGAAYFWMKIWQAVFCRQMWTQLNAGDESLAWSRERVFGYLAAQVLIQSTAIPVLAGALICMVPLAWVYAFYQNVSALGLTQDYGNEPLRHLTRDAVRQSHWAWGSNHLLLVVLMVFSLFVWMSVMITAVYLPMLAKMLLGIDSVFTMNPVATLMNSTFVFGTVLLVFLCVSPLTKTLYVIRCFYGQSRTTGADLLSRLAALKKGGEELHSGGSSKNHLGRVVLLFLLVAVSAAQTEAFAVPSPEIGPSAGKGGMVSSDRASPEEFVEAVKDTLKAKHFQWRLSREETKDGEGGGVKGFVKSLLESAVSLAKKGFKMAGELLERLFGGNKEKKVMGGFKGWEEFDLIGSISTMVLAVFIVLVVVKMIIGRRAQAGVQEARAEVAGVIDLESEAVVATQLPEDEWMRMAREKIGKGEYRLAVRALFLASLAHLGERGLLKVARFKSNNDYHGELSLKARSMPEVIDAFSENVGLFEWVWYGLHEAGDDLVEHFTSNYERITSMTARVGEGGYGA